MPYDFSVFVMIRKSVFLPETVSAPVALPVYGYAVC